MSMWSRLRDRLVGRDAGRTTGELDAPADTGATRDRPTGGVSHPGSADTHSTTGTTPSETYVGRGSGDESTDAGTTGAEVRGDDQH